MSPIGKVFLLLNFVLAGLFLGWASTSLAKGADVAKQLEAEKAAHANTKASLDQEKSDLVTQLNAEKTAKEGLRAERDQQKSLADRNKEDLDALKRANDQLAADIAAIKETLGGYNQTIASVEAAKDKALAEARAADKATEDANDARDAAEMAKRDAEEALRTAEANIAELQKQLKVAQDASARLDTKLKTAIDVTGASMDQIAAQPQIEARVLKVDFSLKPGLVALNVGRSAGVERGMTFEIYSGSTYKGQVRVENVQDGQCSALITRTRDGARIEQGDSASTRL